MTTDHVTLAQAQRLAAIGFPQPHPSVLTMRWVARWGVLTPMEEPPDHWDLRYQVDPSAIEPHLRGRMSHSLAAPVYVSGDGQSGALEWAEREHDWHFYRNVIGWWNASRRPHGYASDRVEDPQPTASDLLDAVLDRIEAAQPAVQEKESP